MATDDEEIRRLANEVAAAAQLLRVALNGRGPAPPHPTHHGPTGDWGDRDIFMRQVSRAVVDLRRDQMKITHKAVAEQLGRSTKALNYALAWHGLERWPWPPTWA